MLLTEERFSSSRRTTCYTVPLLPLTLPLTHSTSPSIDPPPPRFRARTQVMAAIYAKVLRMTRTSIQSISTGQVVNLVSNDVRRFDDCAPFWEFLLFAPLELALVTMMIALELGPVPAVVGVATVMLIIPIQVG